MSRKVCREADLALSEEYKLRAWVRASARKQIYFRLCESVKIQLQTITSSEPQDESIHIALTAAIREDSTFEAHVRKRGGTFLTDATNWPKLHHAGASTVHQAFLDAMDANEWQLTL